MSPQPSYLTVWRSWPLASVEMDTIVPSYHLSSSGWPLTPCQNTLMRVPIGASIETTGSLGAGTRGWFLGGRSTSGSAVEISIWHAASCCDAPAAMPVRESSSSSSAQMNGSNVSLLVSGLYTM